MPASAPPNRWSTLAIVSKELIAVLLLALAGILVGGAYATWKTAKLMAVFVGIAALLALGGAIAWLAN
jgi:hypothetical protein